MLLQNTYDVNHASKIKSDNTQKKTTRVTNKFWADKGSTASHQSKPRCGFNNKTQ